MATFELLRDYGAWYGDLTVRGAAFAEACPPPRADLMMIA